MMISVPMLAHLVLRGGKFMGAQLGQGLASAAMGAGAMSVDPNAVKGAGYLTAEEKALNESGIDKMFMIQNMHNAGAARNIDSGRAYEKRAEASAEMGIDPMSGYAGFKADNQVQSEVAGMTSAASLAGRYGGNVGAGQAKGKSAYMNESTNIDKNQMLGEHYGSPEAAINEMAGSGFKSQVENNSAFSPMSAQDAEKAGLLKAAGKLGGIDAMGRTTGQDITTSEGFEAARQQNEDMKSTFTYADENGAVHKVGIGKDGGLGLDQKTSGDQEIVYEGAYKKDKTHIEDASVKNLADKVNSADDIYSRKTVHDTSVLKDDSTTLKTGNEIQIKDSYKNEAYGYEINGEQIIFEKNAVANMLSTEDGSKHFASLASQFGASGDGRQEIFTTAVKQNLADTLETEGKISSDYKMGVGGQVYGEAHAGFEKKLNDKIPVVGGVNAGASIGAKIDVHGSADQGRSRNEIVSRIDEKMDAVYDMEKIATKAGIGGGFSTHRYGQTVADVLRSEMNDIRGDISKDAPLIELGKKGLDTIQEAGNFHSGVGKNFKDVQAHGDPESSDTGTPETKATLADLK
jgi:hypothetical protein